MRINDCYRALAASVINHALLDREKAVKKLKKDPECTAAIYMLDETNAMAELNATPKDDFEDLTSKYDAQPSSSVEDELAALKASMGK